MSTTAPAVLETELQFPFPHPDSSFLDAFLAKRILSSSRGLGTPWVQLIFSTPNNKNPKNTKGELNTNPLKSHFKGKKAGLVRVNNPKRKEGLGFIWAGWFSDTLASLRRGGQGRVSRKATQNELGSPGKWNAKTFPRRSGQAFSFF